MIILNCFKALKAVAHRIVGRLAYYCWYAPVGFILFSRWEKPEVETLEDTMHRLVDEKASICRYGDGEFSVAVGAGIGFQKSSALLAERLNDILRSDNDNILIAIPDVFGDLSKFTYFTNSYWTEYRYRNIRILKLLLSSHRKYSNSFITRFSTDYREDRTNVLISFYRKLFKDRVVYIVEGNQTRIGVGNDLLSGAAAIYRILAPAENAFSYYDEILQSCKRIIPKDALVVIALGPTATVLAYDLAKIGYHALDLGHFGEQYEYYIHGSGGRKKDPAGSVDNESIIKKQILDRIGD